MAPKRVEDAETAITREQEAMNIAQNMGLTTKSPK